MRYLDNVNGEDKAGKDFVFNSVGGISTVTPLQVKSEGHPVRRKKENGDLKASIQKAGSHFGKVSLVTLMTTAIVKSKKQKSD